MVKKIFLFNMCMVLMERQTHVSPFVTLMSLHQHFMLIIIQSNIKDGDGSMALFKKKINVSSALIHLLISD